jgi:tetratricopeptide (TPR) repeat protein
MGDYNQNMVDEEILHLSVRELQRLTAAAFSSYGSLLELSRSLLAHASLVDPALVLDDLEPTPDERGRALRVVLQWAVGHLAPSLPRHPLGTHRPFDDLTWQDPMWWEYNILRHRYLQPLSSDAQESLGTKGFTEALIALTGIPGKDRFFELRSRAIRAVTRRLRQQMVSHRADDEIRQAALEDLMADLRKRRPAWRLMGLAATFDTVFSRRYLLELARDEGMVNVHAVLAELLANRFLQQGDGGASLWVSPILRPRLRAAQPPNVMGIRHRRVANYYREHGQFLQAAWHLYMARRFAEAARTLVRVAPSLVEELQVEEVVGVLRLFRVGQLERCLWFEVQKLLSDLLVRLGEYEEAIEAAREALKAAGDTLQQARIYRRLGKLYEERSQWQALDYYRRAVERLPRGDPEMVDVLKDRAWVHIHRQEWESALSDLEWALETLPPEDWLREADVHNALASLYRQQEEYEDAVRHAQRALALREEHADLRQLAESWSNLGLIFAGMGDLRSATQAYGEALRAFEGLDLPEAIATVQLNMGMALHLVGQPEEALPYYRVSLQAFADLDLPLGQAQTYYNLAEASLALGRVAYARDCWRQGHEVAAQAGLEGELRWLEDLKRDNPELQSPLTGDEGGSALPSPHGEGLMPEEQVALRLVREEGNVTARRLMEEASVSKSTATRRLCHLLDLGLVERRGKGRSVCYVLPGGAPGTGAHKRTAP